MNYSEAVQYLFDSAPLFQQVGAGAYKEGLSNTHRLDSHFGHPHRSYKTIHVAGTNGKGSVSHTLAAILQSAGYRVGLYTSPHLVDFRERIRVNGAMIPESRVVRFVEEERSFFEPLHPSFFELATALAFKYFEEERVDVAVIEVGLGGRLDCTNIITPILSVITNISLDHTQFLGDTVEQIAWEKAGIIKPGVPVVVGECVATPSVSRVFMSKAGWFHSVEHKSHSVEHKSHSVGNVSHSVELHDMQGAETELCGTYPRSPLYLAEEEAAPTALESSVFELKGEYQSRNLRTILCALRHLPMTVPEEAVTEGLAHVCEMTGLMGRWQTVEQSPRVICDTGHNVGGWQYLSHQLSAIDRLHVVMGMVSDKDVTHVLAMMPRHARYYFTAASVQRAMPAGEFAAKARAAGLQGEVYPDVPSAVSAAKNNAAPDDTIFIGGSTFVVADYLSAVSAGR